MIHFFSYKFSYSFEDGDSSKYYFSSLIYHVLPLHDSHLENSIKPREHDFSSTESLLQLYRKVY